MTTWLLSGVDIPEDLNRAKKRNNCCLSVVVQIIYQKLSNSFIHSLNGKVRKLHYPLAFKESLNNKDCIWLPPKSFVPFMITNLGNRVTLLFRTLFPNNYPICLQIPKLAIPYIARMDSASVSSEQIKEETFDEKNASSSNECDDYGSNPLPSFKPSLPNIASRNASLQSHVSTQSEPHKFNKRLRNASIQSTQSAPSSVCFHNPPPNKPLPPLPSLNPVYKCVHSFAEEDTRYLSFNTYDILEILEKNNSGWWLAKKGEKRGFVPFHYLEEVKVASKQSNIIRRKQYDLRAPFSSSPLQTEIIEQLTINEANSSKKSAKNSHLVQEVMLFNERIKPHKLISSRKSTLRPLGKNGQCEKCKCFRTGRNWCKYCNSEYTQNNFGKWTSGIKELDEFIQAAQLKAINARSMLEWIDYQEFTDVKHIADGGNSSVFTANWHQGPIRAWDTTANDWERGWDTTTNDCELDSELTNLNIIILKRLNNSRNMTYLKEARNNLINFNFSSYF
ncbi:15760_t:CDS:2 [Funneliformis mosseae]|uniref:15760_t:CDS:1 n=1 Tax=Funneliformis mosseae TaxID=27381 RepID=A0A9N9D309_FUNMO|nr:15760_t:CDS:2 [Funneliformis mosseae]